MNADGAEFFSYPDITWQAELPPVLYPVPARYARDLEVGAELTVGLPGGYYIHGQVLAREDRETITLPRETEPSEALGISAPLHWWMAKAYPDTGITMQWWPVDYAWVYRDGISPDATTSTPPEGATPRSWLDEVSPSLDEPPTRRPRPAREAGGLIGRALRVQHAPGKWSWRVAVSEPVDVDGDISVQVLPPSVWWITQVTFYGEVRDQLETLPIHRLFAY